MTFERDPDLRFGQLFFCVDTKQKKVFDLRCSGLSFREISEETGIPKTTLAKMYDSFVKDSRKKEKNKDEKRHKWIDSVD